MLNSKKTMLKYLLPPLIWSPVISTHYMLSPYDPYTKCHSEHNTPTPGESFVDNCARSLAPTLAIHPKNQYITELKVYHILWFFPLNSMIAWWYLPMNWANLSNSLPKISPIKGLKKLNPLYPLYPLKMGFFFDSNNYQISGEKKKSI